MRGAHLSADGVPPVVGRVQLDVSVFGSFSVEVDGVAVGPDDWNRVAAARLFKLLMVAPQHRMTREAVGESLWPEMDPDHQAANVRKALHFTRRAIERDRPLLAADASRIAFDSLVHLRLDLDEWLAAAERLRGRQPGTSLDPATDPDLELILRLGQEDLLPDDPYEDWLATLRERVAVLWRALAVDVARDGLIGGRLPQAQALLEALLLRDPADEEAHRLLIELLGADGRHHAARRQFFRCRRELAEAFGTEPARETVAALGHAEEAPPARATAARRARLVGRQAELARIEDALDAVAAGRAAFVVLRGPAGIGKSRLIEHLRDDMVGLGWRVLEGRAMEDAPELTYAPLRAAFRGLTRAEVDSLPEPAASAAAELAPGLGLTPAIRFARTAALGAGFLGVVDRLTEPGPLAIVIDDAHWLDDGSASLLLEAANSLRRRPLLLLIALRTDEPRSSAVERLLAGLAGAGGAEVDLAPLRPRDISALVIGHLGGLRVERGLAAFLVERSAGNPLFCLEVARMLRDQGRIELRDGTWSVAGRLDVERVPQSVTRLVRLRSDDLEPDAVAVLALAAEMGDEFRFDRLVAGSDLGAERVLSLLDEALRVGLVTEAGLGYRFAHPLFRSAVRQQLSPARRAMLLLGAARALAGEVDPHDPQAVEAAVVSGVDPAAVADRALAAAEAGVTAAVPLAIAFALAAGTREASLFQRDIALATLERGLGLWRALPERDRDTYAASPALRVLGDLLLAAAREGEAIDAYREAIAAARDPEQRAAAWTALAQVPYRHADYESVIGIFEEGLGNSDDPLLRSILLMELGWLQFRHQHLEQSLALLTEAEAALRGPGVEVWRMRALDGLWGPLESLGRGDEATPLLLEALAVALSHRDAFWEQRIRTHLAFRMVRGGTPGRARPYVDRALSLGRMMGNPYVGSVASWAAAEMEYALGDDAAAETRLREQLELLAEVGGNPRHEAIAHAQWAHLARRQGDSASADAQAALAIACAARAGLSDREFAERIERYLAAPEWEAMSM